MSHDETRSDETSPAVQDARNILWIVVASIVVFAAIVHLFVF